MFSQKKILVRKNQLYLRNLKERQAKANCLPRVSEYFCSKKTIYHTMVKKIKDAKNFPQNSKNHGAAEAQQPGCCKN